MDEKEQMHTRRRIFTGFEVSVPKRPEKREAKKFPAALLDLRAELTWAYPFFTGPKNSVQFTPTDTSFLLRYLNANYTLKQTQVKVFQAELSSSRQITTYDNYEPEHKRSSGKLLN